MRIVIDMQGAQSSGSWNRGIGRYTMSLALALVRNRGKHEVLLVLNGAFSASVERIRTSFEGLLPQNNILVWHAVPAMAYSDPQSNWRRQSGELVREAFIDSLNPDFVVISSLFEGLGDDAVTSLKRFSCQHLTAVILYDLIPFIHRQPYLENPVVEKWYLEKIEHSRHADLWLGISESSCREGVEYLNLPSERCINISTDADEQFKVIDVTTEAKRSLQDKYGLTQNFVMYTGGIDHRKNIEGLIRAYAKISPRVRESHQLAIVCSVQDDSRKRLLQLASEQGLNKGEMILTGFVPEDELIQLYNLCAAFIFPSWHEGFGLPALEAMRCGAPVIAAHTSSLPEVVGLAEALFDPHSDEAITSAIERVLTDGSFRERLRAHGVEQANKFSWNETAQRTISAMERVLAEPASAHLLSQEAPPSRPKLAYVSPLPPERSGISDYSAELLPALAQYYEIEVVVTQDLVTDTWVVANCPIRSVEWFIANSHQYDRVIYHFGNSAFQQHMFGLLAAIPGVVVVHDFYLSHVLHHMEAVGYAPGCFTEQLYHSHGYEALIDRAHAMDDSIFVWKYPCSRDVLQNSVGVIFHSENSIRLSEKYYGGELANCSVIPLVRAPVAEVDSVSVRKALGFSEKDFVVCSFGMLGPTKLNHRLLKAWFDSSLAKSGNCHLVFVGENPLGEYGLSLNSQIKKWGGSSVRITGWVDQRDFHNYLTAANLGVQLRTLSRGETSAAVLDCMNYGLATIVNANGSMADLDDESVWKLPDEFDDQALIHALETLWSDHEKRNQIGARARGIIQANHNPDRCASEYKKVVEGAYKNNQQNLRKLSELIGSIATENVPESQVKVLAKSMAMTFPPLRIGRTLLVDISELVQLDARTGIQRVVRSVLQNWLFHPPVGWRVEPVYATAAEPYRYARQFTTAFLGIPNMGLVDEPVDFAPLDVFFGLDLSPQVQTAKAGFFQQLRDQGVVVKFLVYDLLCIHRPELFLPQVAEGLSQWLQVVGESDGAVCISQSVEKDLRDWMERKQWKRLRSFQLEASTLGADIHGSAPTSGLPSDAENLLATLHQRPSFLMVGTLEPRKAHAQVLGAFEQLWDGGSDRNLVIVGKQGWLVDKLLDRLRNHPELGKRLFWLEGISDEYLEKIYAASSCLIAASHGEGFGLPLIEAAQNKLPIIARDIPVFREVAAEHAYYFDGLAPTDLAIAIEHWLALYAEGQHPRSDGMPWITWEQSAQQLLQLILPQAASDLGSAPRSS